MNWTRNRRSGWAGGAKPQVAQLAGAGSQGRSQGWAPIVCKQEPRRVAAGRRLADLERARCKRTR